MISSLSVLLNWFGYGNGDIGRYLPSFYCFAWVSPRKCIRLPQRGIISPRSASFPSAQVSGLQKQSPVPSPAADALNKTQVLIITAHLWPSTALYFQRSLEKWVLAKQNYRHLLFGLCFPREAPCNTNKAKKAAGCIFPKSRVRDTNLQRSRMVMNLTEVSTLQRTMQKHHLHAVSPSSRVINSISSGLIAIIINVALWKHSRLISGQGSRNSRIVQKTLQCHQQEGDVRKGCSLWSRGWRHWHLVQPAGQLQPTGPCPQMIFWHHYEMYSSFLFLLILLYFDSSSSYQVNCHFNAKLSKILPALVLLQNWAPVHRGALFLPRGAQHPANHPPGQSASWGWAQRELTLSWPETSSDLFETPEQQISPSVTIYHHTTRETRNLIKSCPQPSTK